MITVGNTTVESYINKKVGTHSHSLLRSGAIPVSSIPGHSVRGQTHYRLSQCNSRPPISAKSSYQPIMTVEWTHHSEILTKIFETWGFPTVDMLATDLQHSAPPVHDSDSGASSTGIRCII